MSFVAADRFVLQAVLCLFFLNIIWFFKQFRDVYYKDNSGKPGVLVGRSFIWALSKDTLGLSKVTWEVRFIQFRRIGSQIIIS